MGRLDLRQVKFVIPLFFALPFLHACKSEVCTNESIDKKRPSRDISCPNGKVCYGGECIAACNAGSERFARCEADGDCKNQSRPFCVDRFCAACETGSYCVPALNICAPVKPTRDDAGEIKNRENPFACEPLDAGPIDGAMFSSDSGVRPGEDILPTHVVSVDIAQISDYAGGLVREAASIEISSLDVSQTQHIRSATVAPASVGSSYRCDLKTKTRYVGTSTPADVGTMGIGNIDENSGFVGDDTEFIASFVQGRYQLNQPVPDQLLSFSVVDPARLSYVGFIGRGNAELGIKLFPTPPSNALLVPYRLRLGANMETDSEADLKAGYRVNRQTPNKLVFLWDFQGIGRSFQVRVRILGQDHEISCTGTAQNERIEVVGRLLLALAEIESLNAGDRLTLYLEQVYERQLDVPIEMGKDSLVDFSIQIRHSHRSYLEFE